LNSRLEAFKCVPQEEEDIVNEDNLDCYVLEYVDSDEVENKTDDSHNN
jgi:hypothetical protein